VALMPEEHGSAARAFFAASSSPPGTTVCRDERLAAATVAALLTLYLPLALTPATVCGPPGTCLAAGLWNKKAGTRVLSRKGDAMFVHNPSNLRKLAAALTLATLHLGHYDPLRVFVP